MAAGALSRLRACPHPRCRPRRLRCPRLAIALLFPTDGGAARPRREVRRSSSPGSVVGAGRPASPPGASSMAAVRRLQWQAWPCPALISWWWQCLLTGAASAAGLGVRAGAEGRGRRAGGGGRRRPGGGGEGGERGARHPLPSPRRPSPPGERGPLGAESWGEKWAEGGRRPSPVPPLQPDSPQAGSGPAGWGAQGRGWAGCGRGGASGLGGGLSNSTQKEAGRAGAGGAPGGVRGCGRAGPGTREGRGLAAPSEPSPPLPPPPPGAVWWWGWGSLCLFLPDVNPNGALGGRRAEPAAAALGEADPAGCWWGRAARLAAEKRMDNWSEERWDRDTLRWRGAVFGAQQRSPLLAFKTSEGGPNLVGFSAFNCWRCLPGGPLFLIYHLALCEEEVLRWPFLFYRLGTCARLKANMPFRWSMAGCTNKKKRLLTQKGFCVSVLFTFSFCFCG